MVDLKKGESFSFLGFEYRRVLSSTNGTVKLRWRRATWARTSCATWENCWRSLLAEWTSSRDGLPPCVKSILPFGAVVRSGKKVPFRSEVSSEDAVDFEKALRMRRRLEALHAALSLPGRLMRVLSTVVQVSALSMGYAR